MRTIQPLRKFTANQRRTDIATPQWTRCGRLTARLCSTLALAVALMGCTSVKPSPAPGMRPSQLLATPVEAAVHPLLRQLGTVDMLLLGEQHDAPEHQAIHQLVVEALAQQGQLAAVVLEMADAGHDTRALPPKASDLEVRDALGWREQAWPWAAYGPAVMTAVAAGVPVLGGNLQRAQHGAVMRDPAWERSVPAGAWQQLQHAVRSGHCNLLPESQVGPMTRIQVARDASMARTAASALTPGRTVLLLTGSQHAAPDVGIPLHWPDSVSQHSVLLAAGGLAMGQAQAFGTVWATTPLPHTDHCAGLSDQALRPAPPWPASLN